MLDEITPLILTFNEGANIRRTLAQLTWAREIVVLDSYSSDETVELAQAFPAVRVLQREFDTFAQQCNFGIGHIQTRWVLSLDADYVLSDELNAELARLQPSSQVAGFRATFKYCVFGHPLRGTLYPARAILYLRDRAKYRDEGHGHRVQIDGPIEPLRGVIFHDDRKPLGRWLASQRAYAQLEAEHLCLENTQTHNWPDRVRRWIWPAAPAAFLYTLLVKGCLFDGWPGWYYALQRTYAELLLSLELLDRRLRRDERSEPVNQVDSEVSASASESSRIS